MLPDINKIKGIHPGAILKREIKKRGLKNKDLALMLDEHAQTISAILKEKRSVNPKLSIRLGKQLGVEEDYFMLLQASYDVKKAYQETSKKLFPNLKSIRKAIFWDTDFDKIDWLKNKRAIIKRVFERGNELEISEILNFYGTADVRHEISSIGSSYLDSFSKNVAKYLH
ncbi:HigA family addiction module antitoxin [Labilibacter marinus]|uniref:HigA family addiction module antitoxin n=1 Tax=Labilibacter marinus TaxID=1477105 RepID=UPI0008371D51|nr:HigA family addiction module antitoxin [Labilibacter marinus]